MEVLISNNFNIVISSKDIKLFLFRFDESLKINKYVYFTNILDDKLEKLNFNYRDSYFKNKSSNVLLKIIPSTDIFLELNNYIQCVLIIENKNIKGFIIGVNSNIYVRIIINTEKNLYGVDMKNLKIINSYENILFYNEEQSNTNKDIEYFRTDDNKCSKKIYWSSSDDDICE